MADCCRFKVVGQQFVNAHCYDCPLKCPPYQKDQTPCTRYYNWLTEYRFQYKDTSYLWRNPCVHHPQKWACFGCAGCEPQPMIKGCVL